MRSRHSRGFTLIELMVVVAIIAIIALIAIPAYSEQMRRGKRTEAMQGISQLQLELEKYRNFCPTFANLATCRDRNGDGDAVDAGEPAYPSATSTYYTFGVSGTSATGYTVTATKKAAMVDPKCGNFTMVVASGVATKGVSSGTKSYCWAE